MHFMLIYRPPETKGFTKKFTGTFSATVVKCHKLLLLGGFAAHQPEAQLLRRALLLWSCPHPQPCCGTDLCPCSSQEDTLCLLLSGRSTSLPQQPNNYQPAGPKKRLQLDRKNNFSALLELSTSICPEAWGTLRRSPTLVPTAALVRSPAHQPGNSPEGNSPFSNFCRARQHVKLITRHSRPHLCLLGEKQQRLREE